MRFCSIQSRKNIAKAICARAASLQLSARIDEQAGQCSISRIDDEHLNAYLESFRCPEHESELAKLEAHAMSEHIVYDVTHNPHNELCNDFIYSQLPAAGVSFEDDLMLKHVQVLEGIESFHKTCIADKLWMLLISVHRIIPFHMFRQSMRLSYGLNDIYLLAALMCAQNDFMPYVCAYNVFPGNLIVPEWFSSNCMNIGTDEVSVDVLPPLFEPYIEGNDWDDENAVVPEYEVLKWLVDEYENTSSDDLYFSMRSPDEISDDMTENSTDTDRDLADLDIYEETDGDDVYINKELDIEKSFNEQMAELRKSMDEKFGITPEEDEEELCDDEDMPQKSNLFPELDEDSDKAKHLVMLKYEEKFKKRYYGGLDSASRDDSGDIMRRVRVNEDGINIFDDASLYRHIGNIDDYICMDSVHDKVSGCTLYKCEYGCRCGCHDPMSGEYPYNNALRYELDHRIADCAEVYFSAVERMPEEAGSREWIAFSHFSPAETYLADLDDETRALVEKWRGKWGVYFEMLMMEAIIVREFSDAQKKPLSKASLVLNLIVMLKMHIYIHALIMVCKIVFDMTVSDCLASIFANMENFAVSYDGRYLRERSDRERAAGIYFYDSDDAGCFRRPDNQKSDDGENDDPNQTMQETIISAYLSMENTEFDAATEQELQDIVEKVSHEEKFAELKIAEKLRIILDLLGKPIEMKNLSNFLKMNENTIRRTLSADRHQYFVTPKRSFWCSSSVAEKLDLVDYRKKDNENDDEEN